jgi:SAM-dependent MidA family methyltransferase
MMTFARYMEERLYGANGYYADEKTTSGRRGDYFTAADVSPVFGRLLAATFAQWAHEFAVRPFHWIEAGAGEGALARHIGTALKKDHAALASQIIYTACERSEARRARLAALAGEMPCPLQVAADLTPLKELPVTGCVFANELIDALPVHRVRMQGGTLEEGFVEPSNNGTPPALVWGRPSTDDLAAYFDRLRLVLPDGYETEVNLAMRAWLKSTSDAMTTGLVVIIDYGRPAHEYYHTERKAGTLRGFRDHEVRKDVLSGDIMDITADVDFTSLALDGRAVGLVPLAFMEMGSFLMNGVKFLAKEESRRAEDHGAVLASYATNPPGQEWAGLRYLIHPEGMGSAFHVLILGKGIDPDDWPFEGNRLARLGLEGEKRE